MPSQRLEAAGCVVEGPTWEQVEEAIRCLDGQTGRDPYTDTALVVGSPGDFPCLTVGGHVDGRYWTSTDFEDGRTFVLVEPGEDGHEVEVTFPYSVRDWLPANELVRLPAVLKAAKTFVERGEVDPSLSWRSTGRKPGPPRYPEGH